MGVHEVFIGSNTEKVVRLADCPVLTVKDRHADFNPKNVVFASNFYGEANDNFDQISDFISLFDAHVHLLKVNTPDHFESTSYTEKTDAGLCRKGQHQELQYTQFIMNVRSTLASCNLPRTLRQI